MDSTPPSRRSESRIRLKSASRLARVINGIHNTEEIIIAPRPHLSLELVSPTSSPSPRRLPPPDSLPLRELLLLSPSPLLRKSKTRRLSEMAEEEQPIIDPTGSRRMRFKNRNNAPASPRNIGRRSRRRLEPEIREERDFGMVEEMGGGGGGNKPRKRRNSGRSKKDKLSLVPSISSSPKTNDSELCNLDGVGKLVSDLIMWRDVAKSSLWFGFGSLCFLSSCFARGVNFSIFSLISQLGLLFLGVSFFSNSLCRRDNIENKLEFKLTEDNILRAARVILPAANLAISRTRNLFSGEPSMTLRVAPFLLIGAEYGHLITLWRLSALGFFGGFTGPKLYSCYSVMINKKVDYLKLWVLETWGACSHKKIVAASAATAFWNLTSMKTRIFAAFLSLVILRYCRQHSEEAKVEVVLVEAEEGQQALVLVEKEAPQKQ